MNKKIFLIETATADHAVMVGNLVRRMWNADLTTHVCSFDGKHWVNVQPYVALAESKRAAIRAYAAGIVAALRECSM